MPSFSLLAIPIDSRGIARFVCPVLGGDFTFYLFLDAVHRGFMFFFCKGFTDYFSRSGTEMRNNSLLYLVFFIY